MKGPRSFSFLNVEHELKTPDDWSALDASRLWLYNLHYFDDLVAADATSRAGWHENLLRTWIAENPPGARPAWEPYPTSLRIVNWIKWNLAAGFLSLPALQSLATQVRWLKDRLEVHLLGNHLWANAKALVFAGLFFNGEEAASWRFKGLSLVRRELSEQILPDGGHFERSPMYHALVLEDLLDLLQLARVFPGMIEPRDVNEWRRTATRMLRWLQVMTHPDGEIALFNDAAFGSARTWAELTTYAAGVGVVVAGQRLADLEPLLQSGYVRLQAGPAVVIADVGAIGPDYLPGHAHADTLSFELSLHGRRILVNGGTSTYDTGDERLRQRGTAAHNTVVVNAADSSEVWSSFRVARRARPTAVSWGAEPAGRGVWLRGSHDGYTRLGVGLTTRTWRLTAAHLIVDDKVDGAVDSAVARFRTHPEFRFSTVNGSGGAACQGRLFDHGTPIAWRTPFGTDVRVCDETWHPRFGVSEPAQVLDVALGPDGHATTEFSWD